MGENQTCEYCEYGWISRVASPKSCPRCKRRFDYKEAKLILEQLGKEFGFNLGGMNG
ncbi:MAG: hypothetical protein KJ709_03035 [Nanoarchaeota archaeon]|nr:hypothetical protein [Nanoarchaeota archaeon]